MPGQIGLLPRCRSGFRTVVFNRRIGVIPTGLRSKELRGPEATEDLAGLHPPMAIQYRTRFRGNQEDSSVCKSLLFSDIFLIDQEVSQDDTSSLSY
jgi:hypothetical protein